ncbi:uncharacterized protein LOC144450988 [Glandiceps talaboti]
MAFYMKPPRGKVPLDKLVCNCRQRLRFLHGVLRCANIEDFRGLCEQLEMVSNSECLIEGTKEDRTTHFILRLVCSGDRDLAAFLIQAETELFKYRFKLMSSEELHILFQSVDQYMSINVPDVSNNFNDNKKLQDILQVFQDVSNGHSWSEVIELFKNGTTDVSFHVPFQYALKSVASRTVPIIRGRTFMTYADLPEVVTSLFEELLTAGVEVAQRLLPQVLTDERLYELHQEMKLLYSLLQNSSRVVANNGSDIFKVRRKGRIVKSGDVDEVSNSFPLCMSHLHRTLRQNHRLRHYSRLQYTLFLKEIGMPVNDAIHLWKMEYSKPHSNHGDGCTHNWSTDGKRYMYSIRHLYGMEGSQTNYRAHSCHSIQGHLLGPGEEGGCPFKHFDRVHLEREFQTEGIPLDVQEELLSLTERNLCRKACQVFLKVKMLQGMNEQLNGRENDYPQVDQERLSCHWDGDAANGEQEPVNFKNTSYYGNCKSEMETIGGENHHKKDSDSKTTDPVTNLCLPVNTKESLIPQNTNSNPILKTTSVCNTMKKLSSNSNERIQYDTKAINACASVVDNSMKGTEQNQKLSSIGYRAVCNPGNLTVSVVKDNKNASDDLRMHHLGNNISHTSKKLGCSDPSQHCLDMTMKTEDYTTEILSLPMMDEESKIRNHRLAEKLDKIIVQRPSDYYYYHTNLVRKSTTL